MQVFKELTSLVSFLGLEESNLSSSSESLLGLVYTFEKQYQLAKPFLLESYGEVRDEV